MIFVSSFSKQSSALTQDIQEANQKIYQIYRSNTEYEAWNCKELSTGLEIYSSTKMLQSFCSKQKTRFYALNFLSSYLVSLKVRRNCNRCETTFTHPLFGPKFRRTREGAANSLARPARKQATATKLGIYSTYSTRSSIHFLARYSNFCKPLKKNSELCPSKQVSAAAMTSASDEKC